jgi:hypothetical protein
MSILFHINIAWPGEDVLLQYMVIVNIHVTPGRKVLLKKVTVSQLDKK